MFHIDQSRLVPTLTYLIIALFVSGAVVSARYRRRLRHATIILYALALALVLAAIVLWIAGIPAWGGGRISGINR